MPVANSGNNVLVDSSGVALANFTNAAASNIKIQNSTIYTITSGAVGTNSNGAILLAKASGAVATLDSRHTFVTQRCSINGGTSTDAPIANMTLSVRGATVIHTEAANFPEITAPMIGDAQTKLVYRSTGVTWNSVHPGTNIQGSQYLFEGGGDSHLSKHPLAIVKDVVMRWYSTSPSDFILGMPPTWGSDNKPATIPGLRFISIAGNTNISMFGWNQPGTPSGFPNQAFDVRPDYVYDVAAPGARPTAIRRSYRRSTFNASAASWWGAGNINAMYLWIDPYTTLSASGVLDSGKTYIRTVNYNVIGTQAADNNTDIVAFRFKPTIVSSTGELLSDANVVVLNTNPLCSADNPFGTFRARRVAAGTTDATGQLVVIEPTTKAYNNSAGYRTGSFVAQNRIRTSAWHKWWEPGVRLIAVSDSRNGLGTTPPEEYAATDFVQTYRRAGSVFFTAPLVMDGPQSPTIALTADASYNAAASTAGITVTYSSVTNITTVTPAAGTYTLDQIYKAIIDFHATLDRQEAETVLPVTQNTELLVFGALLNLNVDSTHTLNPGTTLFGISTPQTIAFNGAGQARANFIYTSNGQTSSVLELRGVKPGASYIAANNASKVTILFGVNGEDTPQTYPIFFPPGSTGLEVYVARKAIGDFIDFEVITLLPGLMWYQFVDIPDEGAKETDPAVLNAYTTLETNTKLYNYIQGIYMRTEEGLKLGNFFLREGRDLKWAAPYSAVVNQSAGSLFSKSSNLFTIKASGLAGDENYGTNILVPPATLTAATNEVITTEVQDADGDSSLTILGGDGAFELWKVTTATATADYATGTKLADVANEKYRYIGVTGFDIVGVDINSNVRRRTSMTKGVRTQAFFVGDQIQVVQAPQITEINNKVDVLQVDLDAIKGTGFTKDVHSLTTIQENVDLAVALSA